MHVTTAAQLAAAAIVPGTEIVVDNDIAGTIGIAGNIVDIDLVIPPGVSVGTLYFGQYNAGTQLDRLRVRGPIAGTYSGGVATGLAFYVPSGDVIIDGIGMRDPQGMETHAILVSFPIQRLAIVNNAIRTAGSGYIGAARDMVVAGNSVLTGERSRAENGFLGAWGFRAYSEAAVFYRNRIEGVRYHRIRMHPDLQFGSAPQYAWVDSNTFVDRHEARIFWVSDLGPANGLPASNTTGAVLKNNQVYAHSVCILEDFNPMSATYALGSSNSFFGVFNAAGLAARASQYPGHNYAAGATSFSAWQEPPAWPYPGNPRTLIPNLIPANPASYNASYEALDSACPGI